jgi:hypothetical protein
MTRALRVLRRSIAGAVPLAAVLSAGSALAAPAAPAAVPLAGGWTIARTSEWPDTCALRLKATETIGGRDVSLHRGCAAAFAWTADITAWRQPAPDELVLQDATRHAVVRFRRGEDGDWVGTGPDGQDYVITRDRR